MSIRAFFFAIWGRLFVWCGLDSPEPLHGEMSYLVGMADLNKTLVLQEVGG